MKQITMDYDLYKQELARVAEAQHDRGFIDGMDSAFSDICIAIQALEDGDIECADKYLDLLIHRVGLRDCRKDLYVIYKKLIGKPHEKDENGKAQSGKTKK